MSPDKKIPPVIVALGIIWTGCVVLFYLLNNIGYYKEKISVFGAFFLKLFELD